MKKLLLLLAFCGCLNAHAQKDLSRDYAYSVSEPYRVFDAKKKFYFSSGDQSLAIKFDDNDILIQKFDNLKPAFVKDKLYEKFFPKNYEVENVLEVNGRFFVFFSSWNGDDDKEQLFEQEIDFASGEFKGNPVLMFQVNGKVARNAAEDPGRRASSWWWGSGGDKFDIFQSRDKKQILVQYRRRPEKKNDKKSFDIIGLGAFNGNMEKVSLHEITMPYTERRMDNLDYKLNNKGDLFMLAKVYHDDSNDDKKSKDDIVANYHIELFTIKAGTDQIAISQFDNGDHFVNGIWLFDTDSDYLVCGGFYSNGKGKTRANGGGFFSNKVSETGESDGVMVFKIKPDGTIYDKYYHEIPIDILNAYESKRTKKKNAKKEDKGISAKIPYLMLKNIEVLHDGSMMLVGEQYHLEVHRTAGGGPMGGGGTVYYTYHYDDILATKIAPDGSLAYMQKIPKEQIGDRGLGGMSFKYFFANDTHYFIYLDNVKNIDLPEGKTPAKHSDDDGGYLTAVRISDTDGSLAKGSVFNARDVQDYKIRQFSTNRIVKTSENSFMLEAYKKQKEDIMIKVTLN
ncbi:hypothetical protein [Flavobacterium sp.]|uniref:hypothetical protein n=1 Tax=Flavobacterium sp. TaxID=239 RepID=UPI0039E64455